MTATTFAQAIHGDRVSMGVLRSRYRPVLELVDVLIGVVPNCDPYLEIWQPGFRSYNLLVPNFLNLPASLLGISAPKSAVGLGMYIASRAADCNYCSAHTCSFALRRGASADAVTGQVRTPGETAVAALAEALSSMPHRYEPGLGQELRSHYPGAQAEWIVMGVAMMGFLNKFMDALGVELEQASVDDVSGLIGPTGWAVGRHGWDGATARPGEDGSVPPRDSAGTMLRVARQAPGAVRLDRRWMAGIPRDPGAARSLLAGQGLFDVPVLEAMTLARPRRALSAMLRDNLDPQQSQIGVGLKALAGLVFAQHADNDDLVTASRTLAAAHGQDTATTDTAQRLGSGAQVDEHPDPLIRATLQMAAAIATSPATADRQTIAAVARTLTSPQIVEVAVWVSVLQLLHRLSLYHAGRSWAPRLRHLPRHAS